jgi:poly-gamma-glutamate synthesis protein (capsule biosynthesis protein)
VPPSSVAPGETVTLFLAGDVMMGRGIDQILGRPSAPELRETYVRSARDYVTLAERAHGAVPAPVDGTYVWGDALALLDRKRPLLAIVNLETSVTVSDDFWPRKPVHYRMHPDNVGCLSTARIDVCALANNHLLDFGRAGLRETLEVLHEAGIRTAGAGRDVEEAFRPARVPLADGADLLVLAIGSESSGIPSDWAAGPFRPGVALFDERSLDAADAIAAHLRSQRRARDLVVASIHWGSNWGHAIPREQIAFAHRLVERGVDLVHGHSSHHVRSIEVHEGKLVLYGCGDLVTDYEGIHGHEAFRGDLGAMYFAGLSRGGGLARLGLTPSHMQRLRLTRAEPHDDRWLAETLTEVGAPFASRFELDEEGLHLANDARRERRTVGVERER